MNASSSQPTRGRGRPATISADAIAETGLRLFLENGFDATTMTQIALAAGVGRKTMFTYFPSKADIVWNRFHRQLATLSAALADSAPDVVSTDAVVTAVLAGLETKPTSLPAMRAEVLLIEANPSLQAYAYLRGAPWRATISEFLASREGLDAHDVLPEVLGYGYWHAMFIGFRRWIGSGDASPEMHVEAALTEYSHALTAAFGRQPPSR